MSDPAVPVVRRFLLLGRLEEVPFTRLKDGLSTGESVDIEPGAYELSTLDNVAPGGMSWYVLRGSDLGVPTGVLEWAANPGFSRVLMPDGREASPPPGQFVLVRLVAEQIDTRARVLEAYARDLMAQAAEAPTLSQARALYGLAAEAYVLVSALLPLDHPQGLPARIGAITATWKSGVDDLRPLRDQFCYDTAFTREQFRAIVDGLEE